MKDMQESMPAPVPVDLRVQALNRDLEELKLPDYDASMLRENLQEIIYINGTKDPAEQRYKRMLLTQTGMAISLHKRQSKHTAECILNRMVVRDAAGNPIKMPWDDDIASLRESIESWKQDDAAEEQGAAEEVSFGGKFFRLATFKGKQVTKIVTVAISVLIVIGGVIVTVKLSKDQLSAMVQTAIKEAVRHEAGNFGNNKKEVIDE